jgi:hypothetical protein
MMNKIIASFILLSAFLSISSHSNYDIINEDYILGSEQIEIQFHPSLIKKFAHVKFQPCMNCKWIEAKTYKDTQYFDQYLQIDFKHFRKLVKRDLRTPPKDGYRVFISIDKRNNNIFNMKWDYVEL